MRDRVAAVAGIHEYPKRLTPGMSPWQIKAASAAAALADAGLAWSDVDALYSRLVAAGCPPDSAPRDAEWGERFFHLTDPDGHELSFARPLRS